MVTNDNHPSRIEMTPHFSAGIEETIHFLTDIGELFIVVDLVEEA